MRNYNYIRPLLPKNITLDCLNSRARCFTGTNCNYSCNFCYYKKRLDVKTEYDIIKNDIIKLSSIVNEIELSGGESSIHDDWFKILDDCVKYDFKNISTLSNGSKFKNIEFLEQSKQHGLNEILYSVHGIGSVHDNIVNQVGAFNDITQAIENTINLEMICRINCTVTKDFEPESFAEFIKKYNIKQINLLPVNNWEDHKQIIRYEDFNKKIFTFIDILKDSSVEINVRYIPLCFMKGYEKYVVGTYHHIFDKTDWNILMMDDISNTKPTIQEYWDKAYDNRLNWYTKPRTCLKCKYFLICDGIENNSIDYNILVPEYGEKIYEIN